MTLIAYGINHETAPLEVREKVSFSNDMVLDALVELRQQAGVYEAAIFSTCNRTEIYCNVDDENNNRPIEWLHHFHEMRPGLLSPFLYKHPNMNAVRHVLRVASGLDSMILGEPQVLGQLKEAYKRAIHAGSIGHALNRLFQHSFHVAKEVRSNTAIGNHPVSVAFASVRLAQQIFGALNDQTALLVGAGETINLVAKYLYENGLRRMIIANRTLAHSQHLANTYCVYAIATDDIANHLAEADIIISATASPVAIIEKSIVEQAIRLRKHKPMLMVDLAVPRDIALEVGALNDVYLYNVDDLKGLIQDNLQQRQQAAIQAEGIVDLQTQDFMAWLDSRNTVSMIRALRDHADTIQQETIKTGLNRLNSGADPRIVLKEMARTLSNKLIHAPSSQLRNARAQDRKQLLQAVAMLYKIGSDKDDEC